ncbi:MAG: U32 family peptidase [Dehalococcoidia bacterium]|nr:U32 family peptidase [Dehalococcoidia bacterium]
MKLLSPVDRVEEVEPLIEAGADELYCGLLTEDWHRQYIAGSINRRPGGAANFTTFERLEQCLSIARSHSVPVFLTLNEHYYIEKQYPYIEGLIERAEKAGVSAFIVADLAIILLLREMGTRARIIISTGGTTFNSSTAKFYLELGASRIILPRHLTISEIGSIVNKVKGDIEFEVFVLNSRCPNVDGLCTFHHGLADKSIDLLYRNACMLPYNISVAFDEGAEDPGSQISVRRQRIWELVHVDDFPCGACALWDFNQLGIDSVKIVGRGNQTARKLTDVKFLRSLLNLLSQGPTRQEFQDVARRRYRETYKRPCRIYMCYYPEVMTA